MSLAVVLPRTDRRAHWLLTIEIAGQTHRYAVDDVTVTDAGGTTYLYRGGLDDLSVSESLTGGAPSVAVSILDPGAGWAAQVAAGAVLDGGTATLVLWTEGGALETALWVAGGLVTAPEYGTEDEPLTLSIEPQSAPLLFPPAAATISSLTWPVTGGLFLNERTNGWCYPWVFGEPGKLGGPTSFQTGVVGELLNFRGVPVTPGYVAEYGALNGKGANPPMYLDNQIVIAGHPVAATQAVMWAGEEAGYCWRWPITTVTDGAGREVAMLKSDAQWPIVPEGQYWIAWDSGGGLDITGAASVLRYMLEQAGEVVDAAMWDSVTSAQLDGYRLDFAVGERVDPHEWAAAHLGELLPLARRYGPRGCWYEVIPWATASPADALAWLDGSREPSAGLAVVRSGRVAWTGHGEVVTRATLRYRRYAGSRYAAQIEDATTYGGDRTARGPLGEREADLTCDVVADTQTAGALLSAYLAWRSTPRRLVTVEAGIELLSVPLGSVVCYTEREVSMQREVAVVIEREISRDRVVAVLGLVERAPLRGSP